jgi:signal transduction histidine kinase
MTDFSLFDNINEAVCIFSDKGEIIFKNKQFMLSFPKFKSFERFKKQFNFNVCLLSSDNIANMTPLDFLMSASESFHTICQFQRYNDEIVYFYIYSFSKDDCKIVVFKDITSQYNLNTLESRFKQLQVKYDSTMSESVKFSKMQEHAQNQVLKMAIINRISLVIRETNDIETVLVSALTEIHNLIGAYKTYFSVKEKNAFLIKYCINNQNEDLNKTTNYEEEVLLAIKNKEIVMSSCLKEYLNSDEILHRSVNRIIIPVYNKNKLLGIIVTFTKHKFSLEENREILQSISVQLASSIIQAELIQQLNKKNKKLEKTLTELKETQIQLINTEKMASVGQLVSGVAHEINTPLASISSNSNLINKIISKGDTLETPQLSLLKELNDLDIEAAQRISNIVKSLKRFVRLDEAEFQAADINNEIDLTLKLTAHEFKNNIKIIKNYSKLPPVNCAVNMLNQVFMNLFVNAAHSIYDKGSSGEITVTTSHDDKNLCVKIKDNGMGMNSDVQNKIFNVGFTTKKIGIGTGLGLSISKKIIELHKGSISFVSKECIGTEFTILIPLNL